jgi:osmotically-inducible protein OsmY
MALAKLRMLVLAGAVFAGGVTALSSGAWAQDGPTQQSSAGDARAQADMTKLLGGKRFREVTAKVSDGVATLTGTVGNYYDKVDAAKRAQKSPDVRIVRNEIQVLAPEVSDQELGQKLANKIAYDAVGYGTVAFDAVNVGVQQGVVTLGGFVVNPRDHDSAIALVSTYPGVKGLVDHIQVGPPSPNDDRIRRTVAQAIYGYPVFTKYVIDPVKPIRIVVINGNVTLVGSVASQGEKEQAFIRANGVPGVFKVTNDLQVEGGSER